MLKYFVLDKNCLWMLKHENKLNVVQEKNRRCFLVTCRFKFLKKIKITLAANRFARATNLQIKT